MITVLPRVRSITSHVLDLLFPLWCIGCGREGEVVCRSCRETIRFIGPSFCERCGRPVLEDGVCHNCAGIALTIDGIRAPFLFQGILRQAVHELKYRNLKAIAPFLAGEMASYLQKYPLEADILVPVPLHARRLKERGYNQSELTARYLSALTGIPWKSNILVRQRHSPPLARSASREERRENIAGAFAVSGEGLAGKNIILVDDVSTTGSTLDACAAVIKAAGAQKVWGLVAALEL